MTIFLFFQTILFMIFKIKVEIFFLEKKGYRFTKKSNENKPEETSE